MSNPEGKKELWKNCTWHDDSEKLAFFNHYFKNSTIVSDHMKSTISLIKDSLIGFIEKERIEEGGKERQITIKDILQKIKEV